MSYWIHVYTYFTQLLSHLLTHFHIFLSILSIHSSPVISVFIPSLAHSSQARLLSSISAFSIMLPPPLLLFPNLVSFVFKLINLDELLDHNNLQVFEFFMSLQPACRTTAANFETVALSRQTVHTHIISLEVSYAAGLQSEICLPFPSIFPSGFFFFFFNSLFELVCLIPNIQNDLEQKDESIPTPGSVESTQTDFSWRKITLRWTTKR